MSLNEYLLSVGLISFLILGMKRVVMDYWEGYEKNVNIPITIPRVQVIEKLGITPPEVLADRKGDGRLLADANQHPDFRFNPDFSSVNLGGKAIILNASQATFIETLWMAFKNGTPAVGKAHVMELVGLSDNTRPQDIFKNNKEAWKALVKVERNGFYSLNL